MFKEKAPNISQEACDDVLRILERLSLGSGDICDLLKMRRCETIFWRPGTGDQFGETSQDIKIKNKENQNKDIVESSAV